LEASKPNGRAKVEAVLAAAMKAFGEPEGARHGEPLTQRLRLWNCATEAAPVLLENPLQTLREARLVDGQLVRVEDILESGEWSGELAPATGQAGSPGKQLARASTRPNIVGVTGLRNLGNTCYMNSALQVGAGFARPSPEVHGWMVS
jgi:hypothetical protein